MANRRRGQGFLAKASDEVGVVTDEIRKNDFDCVRGFQKDVTRFINHAHAALAQTLLELVTAIKDGLAADGRSRGRPVIRTVQDVVGETTTTGWAFFHSLVLLRRGSRASHTFTKDFSGCGQVRQA